MAGRTERCSRCGMQLRRGAHGPVKCIGFWSVNQVPGVASTDHGRRIHERFSWTKNWMKGLGVGTLVPAPPSPLQHAPPLRRYPSAQGSRRALLVGISYKSMKNELQGTVNDVNCVKFLLRTKYGFPDDCIVVLTEEEGNPSRTPTRRNMVEAMRWLVKGSRPGDSLFFHFSGHGSQRFDMDSDEQDGYDETLCPLDYEANGMISDDEVHATMVEPLPAGVTLHAVVDACHSGSSLDLPYICKMRRNGFWQWEDVRNNKWTRGGTAICFSGCDDNQTSSDTSAFTGDTMTGAMTYCFIQALESEPGITYRELLLGMRTAIRGTGPRIGGRPISSILRRVFQNGLTQAFTSCFSKDGMFFRKTAYQRV